MNILCLNQNWFVEEFREAGHQVMTVGLTPSFDISLETPLIHLDNIAQKAFPEETLDAVVIHDNSGPIAVDGIAEAHCPIIFYSVDTHHHHRLHAQIAKVVDYVFVAQRDFAPLLESSQSAPIEWMPLWASQYVESSLEKEYGALFVGTLNPELNRERVEFFSRLSEQVHIHIQNGAWWDKFPHAELVINQTVKGDLNFRVFEAMMCGTMLLTERVGNGLLELFEDGRDLVTYKRGDVDDAAEKIQYYLAHPEEMHAIAAAGRQRILDSHLPAHRAARFIEVIEQIKKRPTNSGVHFAWMSNLLALTVPLRHRDPVLGKRALINTLRSAELALRKGEELDDTNASELAMACCELDRSNLGISPIPLFESALQLAPEKLVLRLALLRMYLNHGDRAKAEEVARPLTEAIGLHEVFHAAEAVVQELLKSFDEYDPRLFR